MGCGTGGAEAKRVRNEDTVTRMCCVRLKAMLDVQSGVHPNLRLWQARSRAPVPTQCAVYNRHCVWAGKNGTWPKVEQGKCVVRYGQAQSMCVAGAWGREGVYPN